MAKEREREASVVAESPAAAQADTQARIVWDSSNMRSAYANVFNVAGTREEIILFFGLNQAWDAAQKELKVQVSDRIVLSPFTAKRLATVLGNVIKDYESRHGSLDVEPRRPA